MTTLSQLYEQAQRYLPGGVCATARANAAIGHPLYVSRGDGPHLGCRPARIHRLCMSHGDSLLGHADPDRGGGVESLGPGHHLLVRDGIPRGTGPADHRTGALCRNGAFRRLGNRDGDACPAFGRSATGRDKIIKFEGHFHGYADALNFSAAPPLDQAGPANRPSRTRNRRASPPALCGDIAIIPFNDEAALDEAFAVHGREAAALMLEPINYDQVASCPSPASCNAAANCAIATAWSCSSTKC